MEGVVLYVVLVKVFVSESSKKLYVFIFTIVSYGNNNYYDSLKWIITLKLCVLLYLPGLPLLYVLVVSVPIGFLLNGMKHYYYIQEDTSVSACVIENTSSTINFVSLTSDAGCVMTLTLFGASMFPLLLLSW